MVRMRKDWHVDDIDFDEAGRLIVKESTLKEAIMEHIIKHDWPAPLTPENCDLIILGPACAAPALGACPMPTLAAKCPAPPGPDEGCNIEKPLGWNFEGATLPSEE